MAQAGRLYVVSAPSGAGKTSLVKALVDLDPALVFSISYTTRPKRPNEIEGKDYFFVDKGRFDSLVEAGEFLEHAEVFGNCYGTGRSHVEALLAEGHNVILEIDWQGARQIRAAMPGCRTIFVLPPSVAELERRLRGRSTDDEATIQRRLSEASADLGHWGEFDYVIVNDDFTTALEHLAQVVRGAGEQSSTAEPALRQFVEKLGAAAKKAG
ncbi:MAG: guanylate kinase [Gammaproteobacteria bacterium]|nr:guanylate kinase [Gammaproteobacteria bacterium]